ncbi:fatty acid desaturase family protein [Rhodococcus opacus]|uniref:fatty acid desaturase family protein n=1 Tax=Rhodococcus TaxID=1827 RepID=UPI00076A5893|nr:MULTISPECIES: acyl-CoA desaturase [Rhodococcus]KXF56360.1 fatty acid desaturase [Rhodococcus sp. SC4]NDV07285.1 acyl-CoA desaturase [Rhodococcus sp. IEGM 248]RZK84689.1 MAG: acyl-CoA desaturase [Rhodococcus sp. (in: high G+C Gram-positive bacteria)]KXX58471.1 fatty acid desaturase [Rhodococcus sp. LB1]MDI9936854.1 acyl-CoA desaturase [Rhodococcus sp. IEGM 1351]
MAITDIKEFAHLTEADIESLGRELDAIRLDVEDSRGVRDARYIRRAIRAQRLLELGGRVALFGSRYRPAWLAGTAMLSLSKIIENMELGHNVMHGQWDWMNDPEIHSMSWEWDQTGPSEHWKRAHNYSHHTFTNIVGMDSDVGFGILRMTRDEEWRPINLLQPFANIILAATFEWGIALHDLTFAAELEGAEKGQLNSQANKDFGRKIFRQVGKDFLLFPVLAGPAWKSTLTANATANLVRNLWAYVVIFCGHFPDGAEKFTVDEYENETRHEWYLRQMLGSANFDSGKVMGFMSGNLSYQIEHHLFPDLPSNRYPEIAVKVRALCEKYDLPYTTGSLAKQYLLALRTIHKLALPDRFLRATADDAPETSSERKFRDARDAGAAMVETLRTDPVTGQRRGLLSALRARAEAKIPRRRR